MYLQSKYKFFSIAQGRYQCMCVWWWGGCENSGLIRGFHFPQESFAVEFCMPQRCLYNAAKLIPPQHKRATYEFGEDKVIK